jgi:hypothetical protein
MATFLIILAIGAAFVAGVSLSAYIKHDLDQAVIDARAEAKNAKAEAGRLIAQLEQKPAPSNTQATPANG